VRSYKKALENNDEDVVTLINNTFNGDSNVIELIKNATVKNLLPTEVITKLVDLEVLKSDSDVSLIFDGFPRSREQLPYTRNLTANLRHLGFKILLLQIELAEGILNERRGSRRVCPKCGRVGNIQTLYTGSVDFDSSANEFILRCDSSSCNREKMVNKVGDLEELKTMEKREKEMDEMARVLREEEKEIFIHLRSDIPINNFVGAEEELNHYTELSLENGVITKNQKRQVALLEGKEVYSVDPKGIMPIIIKEIVGRLS
jgi:adenylate kinase family enzyme